MEAMVYRILIVTSVGNVPILVEDGINGIVIPPGNAHLLADSIIYLVQNPELRNLISKADIGKTCARVESV
jgi:glycosyltransferase involved in cell wall biosynthesis